MTRRRWLQSPKVRQSALRKIGGWRTVVIDEDRSTMRPYGTGEFAEGDEVNPVMQEPTLSHSQQNYSRRSKALASKDGLEIDVVKMEVLED